MRWPGRVVLLGCVLLTVGCDAPRMAENATRFGARMTCSCVFVSEREPAACLLDLPDGSQWLDIEVDRTEQSVRAGLLWIEGEARYTEGQGCQLLD